MEKKTEKKRANEKTAEDWSREQGAKIDKKIRKREAFLSELKEDLETAWKKYDVEKVNINYLLPKRFDREHIECFCPDFRNVVKKNPEGKKERIIEVSYYSDETLTFAVIYE